MRRFALALALLLVPSVAAAITVGPLGPGSDAAVTSSRGDNDGYATTPGNAYNDDTLSAVDTNSGTSSQSGACASAFADAHRWGNFSFSSIPSDAVIQSVTVTQLIFVDSTTATPGACARASWDNGTTWTSYGTSDPVAVTGTTVLTLTTATHPITGHEWTSAELQAGTLLVETVNVADTTGTRDFSLDFVSVTVEYIPGGRRMSTWEE